MRSVDDCDGPWDEAQRPALADGDGHEADHEQGMGEAGRGGYTGASHRSRKERTVTRRFLDVADGS